MECLSTNGTFAVTFRENTTLQIPYDSSLFEFKGYLEQLYTIGKVLVSFDEEFFIDTTYQTNFIDPICANPAKFVYIEFLTETGRLPLLEVPSRNTVNLNGHVLVTRIRKGNKEDEECSSQV